MLQKRVPIVFLRRSRLNLSYGVKFFLIIVGVIILVGCSAPREDNGQNLVDIPWAEILPEVIPEDGATTTYGIPLSLKNTQQFIEWNNSIKLSVKEEKIRDMALGSLAAPCCDKYPMSTC